MCRVSFTDTQGMTHSVRVTAASLFEAAALGLAEFRRCTMMDAAPGTTHEVPMPKLSAWLESNGKSPNEQAVKVTLRELLGRK